MCGEKAAARARKARTCRVMGVDGEMPTDSSVDLLAIHRPSDFRGGWDWLTTGEWKPGWVIVQNREPDPRWCRLLESSGYRLKFFFHDDEYFQLKSRQW